MNRHKSSVSNNYVKKGLDSSQQLARIAILPAHPNASRTARCLSELLGTYLLVLIGPGTVVLVSLVQGTISFEGFIVIGFAFGGTVALIILLLGRISGAHINPAITLAHTVVGKTSRDMFVPYLSSQFLGALLGALTLKLIFGSTGSTADLGTTKLASGISAPAGILLETAGTFLLAMSGFVASSRIHKKSGEALLIGTTLFLLILALGPLTGASLNPARSLGPAIASGYLTNLYVYWIGPLAGGLIAGLLFRFVERPRIGKGSGSVRMC
jgi:MIP family channel proteins